jgi:hypothetical protein
MKLGAPSSVRYLTRQIISALPQLSSVQHERLSIHAWAQFRAAGGVTDGSPAWQAIFSVLPET